MCQYLHEGSARHESNLNGASHQAEQWVCVYAHQGVCDCQRCHSGSPVLIKDGLKAERFCCVITVIMSCSGVGDDFAAAAPIPELQLWVYSYVGAVFDLLFAWTPISKISCHSAFHRCNLSECRHPHLNVWSRFSLKETDAQHAASNV